MLALQDFNLAPAVIDQASTLQITRRNSNGGPLYTEHLRQKFVRQVERIRLRPIG